MNNVTGDTTIIDELQAIVTLMLKVSKTIGILLLEMFWNLKFWVKLLSFSVKQISHSELWNGERVWNLTKLYLIGLLINLFNLFNLLSFFLELWKNVKNFTNLILIF